jgi:hypothetical protein
MRQMTVGGLPSKSKDDLRPAGIGSKSLTQNDVKDIKLLRACG